jgi:DNA polymerase (family X)
MSDYQTEKASRTRAFNGSVAQMLRDIADVLQQQDANPFRIDAYRKAAGVVQAHGVNMRTLVDQEGVVALMRLPHIGQGLAAAIEEIVHTGSSAQLNRLKGETDPETLFQTVPGIGPAMAKELHDRLHVDTLEGLGLAARDGRLQKVPGVGPRRAAALQASLLSVLADKASHTEFPDVSVILDVDREYQLKAAAGSLSMIAPRRFNPQHEAWLPVLHTNRGRWHFTAMFSNTARAHELNRTHDWVVIYYYDDEHVEGQNTVVTEHRGPLRGRRIVRGREGECTDHYERRLN